MVSAFLVTSILVAIIGIGIGAAYTTGALDPVIEMIAKMMFKAEAMAEEKKLQAQGLQEGEDFLKSDLAGNQKADDVKSQLSGIDGLDGLKMRS